MKMTMGLKAVFSSILLLMIAVTIWASLKESISIGGHNLWSEPWAVATLADAYCGFLTFYVWLVYKERSWLARLIWLILILGLGNIAMSVYVLLQIRRIPAGGGVNDILLRRAAAV